GLTAPASADAGALTAAGTPTRMTAFSVTPATASPTGLGVTVVDVSTHLVDPDGIAPMVGAIDGVQVVKCPCVVMEHTGTPLKNAEARDFVPLHLASGTVTDGTWTGQFVLGAAQSGHWGTKILAGDFGVEDSQQPVPGWSEWVDLPSPFTGVGVDIAGTNRPVITHTTSVRRSDGRYVVTGRAIRATSRTVIRNTRFEVMTECEGGSTRFSTVGVRTNSAGVFAVVLTKAQQPLYPALLCVAQVAYPGHWLLAFG
ncbi:MAG: hypothetical protein QOF57_1832, partial [Frankiaceae bacterium]|nr:hypothetical protein [Frankiaceae bacterium]